MIRRRSVLNGIECSWKSMDILSNKNPIDQEPNHGNVILMKREKNFTTIHILEEEFLKKIKKVVDIK